MQKIPKRPVFALLVTVAALRSAASNAAALEYDVTTDGKEVLMPTPPAKPQVNEATTFGVRPGKSLIKERHDYSRPNNAGSRFAE